LCEQQHYYYGRIYPQQNEISQMHAIGWKLDQSTHYYSQPQKETCFGQHNNIIFLGWRCLISTHAIIISLYFAF
jgi:hypothetical protein